MIDCMERVVAYFENMHKYDNDVQIKVRFLDKIFKAAVDKNYSYEEKIKVLRMLIEDIHLMEKEGNDVYAVLDACYCYKLNKALNAGLNVPMWRSREMVNATACLVDKIPDKIYEDMKKRHPSTLDFAASISPDDEILELYNVQIAEDHFYF